MAIGRSCRNGPSPQTSVREELRSASGLYHSPGYREPMGQRILVLDDDDDLREVLLRSLEEWGYESRGAATGPYAIVTAVGWHPDAVLIDIGLPGMDGYETARKLRELDIETLIAVSGSYPEPPDLVGVDFDDHLLKPFAREQLRRKLAAALKSGEV